MVLVVSDSQTRSSMSPTDRKSHQQVVSSHMHRSHEAWSGSFLLLLPADTGSEGSYYALLRTIARQMYCKTK